MVEKIQEEQDMDESDQSEFNSGIATLQRLHEIKKWLASATIQDNPTMLFFHLKAFFKELYPIFSKEKKDKEDKKDKKQSEREEQEEFYQSCLEAVNEYKKEKDVDKKNELMQGLDVWELSLRDLEQKHGLNMALKGDGRFSLGRGR